MRRLRPLRLVPYVSRDYRTYMSSPISTTHLRQDIYRILDAVLETGQPVEVLRGGRRLLIVPADGPVRRPLAGRRFRSALDCTPDELEATSFEGSWSGDL